MFDSVKPCDFVCKMSEWGCGQEGLGFVERDREKAREIEDCFAQVPNVLLVRWVCYILADDASPTELACPIYTRRTVLPTLDPQRPDSDTKRG